MWGAPANSGILYACRLPLSRQLREVSSGYVASKLQWACLTAIGGSLALVDALVRWIAVVAARETGHY